MSDQRHPACGYWRPCCCEPMTDDHCFFCGRPKGEHANGEHRVTHPLPRCTWALVSGPCQNAATNGDVCAYCEDARDKRRD